MDNNIKNNNDTEEKKGKNSKNIKFSIEFNKNGESFQNIMEKILISKIENINKT